ncbi:MAG: hypothetical protein L0154_01120 [Chloroflexi bacterium]|nr:hypothetical protein [Chloroflexota bacterium]
METTVNDAPVLRPPSHNGKHFRLDKQRRFALIDVIEASGEAITLTQDFIVSVSTDSGIYSLPLTLLYEDGETKQVQFFQKIRDPKPNKSLHKARP